MNTWLKLLPIELQEIKEYTEPRTEFDPNNDRRIGEMSEDLKKLYTLFMDFYKVAEQNKLDAKYAKSEKEGKSFFVKAKELSIKAEVLKEIFWISVNDEFELWGEDDDSGVRKGFIIVLSKEKGPKNFLDILRNL